MIVDGTELRLRRLPEWFPTDAFTLAPWVFMKGSLHGTAPGVELLRHEAQHVRDQRRWHVLFWITYFILPIGPSLRAMWEWRAYKVTIRAAYEGLRVVPPDVAEYVVRGLSSSVHLWPMPVRWARRIVEREIAKYHERGR